MTTARQTRLLIGLAAAGATAMGGLSPSSAAAAPAQEGPAAGAPAPETPAVDPSGEDVVEVQELALDGTVMSSATYDASGRAVVIKPDGTVQLLSAVTRQGSGSGGGSSASGCRKVTVKNVGKTVLGYTAYRYNTWTEWCWNRADRKITGVEVGQYLTEVASTMYYRGLVVDDQRFYSWQPGYNKSGYWNERQAQWENCIAKYGCISNDYPRNIIRSHSDGSYTWATTD